MYTNHHSLKCKPLPLTGWTGTERNMLLRMIQCNYIVAHYYSQNSGNPSSHDPVLFLTHVINTLTLCFCTVCETRVDLCFLIDSSGSIRDNNPRDGSSDNWTLQLEFLARLVDGFTVGKHFFYIQWHTADKVSDQNGRKITRQSFRSKWLQNYKMCGYK